MQLTPSLSKPRINENVCLPRETHIPKIAAHCSTDRNTVEIKVRGAFSLHEPDRRPYRAAEGTPSLPTAAESVGLANITGRMDVTTGCQHCTPY